MFLRASMIQLTIDSDIAVTCTENSVYVYDGLPDFVSTTGNHQSHVVLGVFCTQDTQYPVTVEAKTGEFNFSTSVMLCIFFCLIKLYYFCYESNLKMICYDCFCTFF